MRADHLVKDLEQFWEDLTRHKELWENSFGDSHLDAAEFPIRNVEELRTQCRGLARSLGRLRPFLTKFRPSWIMEHPASRVTWDALEEAVSPDALPLRKGPSLEAVLPLINQVIGQVKAFGSDVEISVDPESPTSIAKRGGPERIIGLLLRFHLVAQQLRRRHDARATLDIKDEYDAQDLLHSLLRLFFDDIRAEECTPSYAGGSSRMDFLIKAEKTVVEVKMTRESLTERQVGTELIQDSARYSGHEDCRTLICFVYDPQGRIGNPEGLEKDLSRDEGNLKVRVLVVPRET